MTETKINAWRAAAKKYGMYYHCDNKLTMTPSACVYWDVAYFALKPVEMSEDQRSMKVQFFWLSNAGRPEEYMAAPPDMPGNLATPGRRRVKLYKCETGEVIGLGKMITLITDNPEDKPLPSWELMEAQWLLKRIIALSFGRDFEEEE